jgi:hypothetical protein
MAIERFIWTHHAEGKCLRRLLDRAAVERLADRGFRDPRSVATESIPHATHQVGESGATSLRHFPEGWMIGG